MGQWDKICSIISRVCGAKANLFSITQLFVRLFVRDNVCSHAEPTNEREQSYTCIDFVERGGGRRSQIAESAEFPQRIMFPAELYSSR